MSLSSGLSCGLSGGLSGLSRGGGVRATSLVARLAALLGEDASFYLPGPDYWFTNAGKTTAAGNTDLIRVWADGSPNGRDLAQATTTARPQATLSGGFWGATLDAVDDSMTWTGTEFASGSDWTLAAVVANTGAPIAGQKGVLRVRDASAGNAAWLITAADKLRCLGSTGTGSGNGFADTADTVGESARIATGRVDATTVEAQLAGSAVITTTASAVRSVDMIDIGATVGTPLGGVLYGLVAVPSRLSDSDLAALRELLAEVTP